MIIIIIQCCDSNSSFIKTSSSVKNWKKVHQQTDSLTAVRPCINLDKTFYNPCNNLVTPRVQTMSRKAEFCSGQPPLQNNKHCKNLAIKITV
jgi:hypothetical protein